MRLSALLAVIVLAGAACAQQGASVEHLIQQLGSADFRTREAARQALLERPHVESGLRAAMQSKDIEIAKRAAGIVEEIENRPFRPLDEAIAMGQIERATEFIAGWRANNPDKHLWKRITRLSSSFIGRPGVGSNKARGDEPPRHLCMGGPFSCYDFDPTTRLALRDILFLSKGIDLSLEPVPQRDKRWDPGHWQDLVAFSTANIHVKRKLLIDVSAFALGDVKITGNLQSCLIVSAGNVSIDGTMVGCLVIAKGAVHWRKPVGGSVQIISGGEVHYDKTRALPDGVVIVEKEANPLGCLHWKKKTP